MAVTYSLSNANIYNVFVNNAKVYHIKIKLFLDHWKSKYKFRNKFFRSNYFLIICIFFLLFCLFLNRKFRTKENYFQQKTSNQDLQLFINRIQDISIIDKTFLFNITYNITFNNIPSWLNQYGITHLFNFYWLQNGAYLWHLQRLTDFKQISINSTRTYHQIFLENSSQINIIDHLNHHPEYGIIIDTSSDPIQPLFPQFPQSTLPIEQTCAHYSWLDDWYPCTRQISSFSLKPLITYALYDVTIDVFDKYKQQTNIKMNHFNEIIFLFDTQQQLTNETFFIQQILPRLIRLLALTPETSLILLPHLNTKVYISQYIDILIERGIVVNRKRFIEYNSNETYHSNILYSTSSPRSDMILLNKVLIANQSSIRREFILVIRNHLDDYSYNQIVQTLNQFEFPGDFEYLHVQEYHEQTYDLKKIRHLFQHARIIIGMPSDILSHIIWCLPHTHIIEIIQEKMTTDYYEISLQLQLNYWLVMTTKTKQIDIIDFRNLMMKVLADIDV